MDHDRIVEIGARALYDPDNDGRWAMCPDHYASVYRDGMRAVLAAFEEAGLAVEQGWCFDMEKAPKDGTPVDLWVEMETGARRIPDAIWVADESDWHLGDFLAHQFAVPPKIIAWRPLPDPPAAKADPQ